MRHRDLCLASGLTAAALAGVAAVAAGRLPAGARLPTHWGPDGAADRFADADVALFLPVALTVAISLVMAALPALEPLQDRLERSAPLHRTAWIGLLGFMVLVEAMVAGPAFGWNPPATTMLAGVGALLVLLGNALPKSRPNFFIGIRLPWTLTDPDNWIATHRFGGRIAIGGGIGLIALSVVPMAADARASFVVVILLVVAATPVLYSFFLWRQTGRT